MAKQYIPKISGLLTEPNPIDAPSNSLSEAENVIIDQNGKVQARHGLNVEEYIQTISDIYVEKRSVPGGTATNTNISRGSYDQTYDLTKYVDGNKTTTVNSDTTNYKNHYLDTGVNCSSIYNYTSPGNTFSSWSPNVLGDSAILSLNSLILNPFKDSICSELTDGTPNAEHYISQSLDLYTITSDGTFTLFVKPTANARIDSTSGYALRLYVSGSYADFKINEVDSPSILYVNAGSNTNVIASYEIMRINNWYRVRLSLTLSSYPLFQMRIQIVKYSNGGINITPTYVGTQTTKFYIFGSQLSKGLDIVPYVQLFYSSYAHASEYAKQLPFMKLVEYKNSSDTYKTILLAKQTKNPYNFRDTSLGKSLQYNYSSSSIINRYYIIDNESSEIQKYGYIPYNNITNSFINKNSLYLHTENGLAEANVDSIDQYAEDRFFTYSWPAFPRLSYELTQSSTVANWLYAGYKCAVKMTFYREMGYSDKEDEIYESEPSTPLIIKSINSDSIPRIFIDFPAIYDNKELYQRYNLFTKLNNGRKFGIKLYRTKAVPLFENLPDEYFQCIADYSFEKFFVSKISTNKTSNYDINKYFALGDDINITKEELNIGDTISFVQNENISNHIYYSSLGISSVQSKLDTTDYYIPNTLLTTDTSELLKNTTPIRLIVKDKIKNNGIYFYLFYTTNSSFRYTISSKTVSSIPANTKIDFTNTFTSSITDFIPIIKSPVFLLELNDSSLKSQSRIYTDSNVESAKNTNFYAPVSKNSIQYKDFRVYYNINKSLTATLFVSKQPSVSEFLLKPSISNNKDYNKMFTKKFVNYTKTLPIITNSVTVDDPIDQRYFIDSPIFSYQSQEIETNILQDNFSPIYDSTALSEISIKDSGIPISLPISTSGTAVTITGLSPTAASISFTGQITGFGNGSIIGFYTQFPTFSLPTGLSATKYYYVRNFNYSGSVTTFNISETQSGSLVSVTSAGSNIYILPQSAFDNARIKCSIFAQNKLTLKLTSNSNVVNTVSIKTYPFYNRNGYYDLLTNYGSLDNRSSEYNGSLLESNGPQNISTTNLPKHSIYSSSSLSDTSDLSGVTFSSGIFQVPGNLKNQRKFDGRITPIFGNASSNLVYSSTNGGTLTVKNILEFPVTSTSRVFDKNAFLSPGHVLIEWGTAPSIKSAILSYSSIDSDTTTANTYIFKQAVVVSGNTSLTAIGASDIAYLYYIPGTNVNNFALYQYDNAPSLDSFNFAYNSTNPTLSYFSTIFYKFPTPTTSTGNQSLTPILTYLSHNDKTSDPIANYSQDGNIRFQGANAGFAKTYEELLDEYTWSIINKFNYELQLNNISARLIKGSSVGELTIDYPDGKKIELRSDYGDHEFYPALSNDATFTTVDSIPNKKPYAVLSERTNNDWYEKNLIKLSRRDIPEISTLSQYAYIGKNTKNIIGAASNVDDLYIFKEDGIWRATDKGKDIPELETSQFSTTLICQASGSIQEINEEIIFLSQYGFMSIANGGIENISGAIQNDILKLIQTSPKDRIQSFVNESKQLYYCTLINEVDSTLDVKSGTYVFNTKTRQWTFINQEILTGISDNKNRNLVAYRQIPITGTYDYLNSVNGISYNYPLQKYTEPLQLTPSLTGILNHYYVSREQFTNNLSTNALDQYDFINLTDTRPLKKEGNSTIYQLAPSSTETAGFNFQYPFGGKTIFLRSNINNPSYNQTYPVIDSYVQFLLNKTIYLKKDNDYYELKLTRVTYDYNTGESRRIYSFISADIPTWFTALSVDSNLTNANIIVGVPAKITFNPESGNQPDTNKLFQEYMIHTETTNKGALMSFKTDSQSSFTTDRRFIYDATATNRNVFRTYIPKNVARGRYLIRRVKHDLPLENLIITGQTIVMRDSGSTRVQKDKDSN